MSVATHLGIDLAEYDARIRTFIPDYEEMLDVAAAAIPQAARRITDLGTGTGALASRCARVAPRAQLVGIDADAAILGVAAARIGRRLAPVAGSFLRTPVPPSDAIVASFSLHHVRTRGAKAALYRRLRAALRPRGVLVTVDCYPASDRTVRDGQREAWLRHLRAAYSPAKARGLLSAWSREDVYVPLRDEVAMLERAGFTVDVLWRRGMFAVLRSR